MTMEPIRAYDASDPPLDGVHVDDRGLVRDVLTLLQTMQHPTRICKDWHVRAITNTSKTVGYEVSATIDTSKSVDWEIHFSDLEILKQLDVARIGQISIRGTGASFHLQVYVTARSVPVMLTQVDIIRVQKRHRWLG